jgi:hypothetical protein
MGDNNFPEIPIPELPEIPKLPELPNFDFESINRATRILAEFQTSAVFNLVNSTYFQNYLYSIKQALLGVSQNYFDTISPIIQAQMQFRTDYLKIVSLSLNTESVLVQFSKQWTQTLISFNADVLGLTFDFQYTRKDYKEQRQVVVELDEGVNENGLEVYQTFEKDGQKYKLVAIPEQNYQKLTNTYTGVIFDTQDIKLAISTQTTLVLETNQNFYFSYDLKTATLFVGNYERTITRGFVHRSLGIISKSKSNMKKVWYYSELIEIYDPEELGKKGIIKSCKDKFYFLKRNLPIEIKDFLIVKSDHVYINEKYIK